jgi:hypothetical protein
LQYKGIETSHTKELKLATKHGGSRQFLPHVHACNYDDYYWNF